MKLLLLLAALPLCSCQTTLPSNSVISGSSGKSSVSVDVSGLTWKDALRKVGLSVAKAIGQPLADAAVAKLQGVLEKPVTAQK